MKTESSGTRRDVRRGCEKSRMSFRGAVRPGSGTPRAPTGVVLSRPPADRVGVGRRVTATEEARRAVLEVAQRPQPAGVDEPGAVLVAGVERMVAADRL